MAFNDLLSSSFLFSIAIIIILIGGIFAYVSYRMSEQDHKITSMLGLISTMAEELQFFRSNLSKNSVEQPIISDDHLPTRIILDPNNIIGGQSTLISVSDDGDSNSESSGSDGDESSGSDDGDESSSSDDDDACVLDLEEEEEEDILNDNIVDLEDNRNIKSIHLEEPIDLTGHDMVHDLDHPVTISISDLEEPDKKPDFKKMPLTKLKEVIVEKGIVTDASKLKKNDILKLLGVE